MSDIKLYYFNVRGRAEPIRLCLVAAGKKYEDIRVTGEEWMAQKEKSPYGQMPYIEYKGKVYGESKAIASFVARECGMAGKTNVDAMRVDEVFCLVSDLLTAIGSAHFEMDAAAKAKKEKDLEETIPKYLGFFEKLLKETGTGYFVGSSLSLADFSVQDITIGLLKICPQILDKYPEVQKMIKNVEGNEKVKAYLDSRPVTDM